MRLHRFGGAAAFLECVEPSLLAEETRNNLILGVAATVGDHPKLFPNALFLAVESASGGVLATALRTPPYGVILGSAADPGALRLIAEALRLEYGELSGFSAVGSDGDAFATAWCSLTGDRLVVGMRQGVYALDAVAALPETEGRMRRATAADTDLVGRWLRDFQDEAFGRRDETSAERTLRLRLSHDDGAAAGFWLWDADDGPRSLAGSGGPTRHGIRIGPVYTPSELRGRGYATGLVAALSSSFLARGRRFCCLYTDLANPTSNAIYRRIGYRLVCDAISCRLESGSSA